MPKPFGKKTTDRSLSVSLNISKGENERIVQIDQLNSNTRSNFQASHARPENIFKRKGAQYSIADSNIPSILIYRQL